MRKQFNPFPGGFKNSLGRFYNLSQFHPAPILVSFVSFAITVVVTASSMNGGFEGAGDIREFETGKVADRDVIAPYAASYIDDDATRIRMESREQLVPAVFRFSPESGDKIRNEWNVFCDFAGKQFNDGVSAAAFRLALQAEYPAFFSTETVNAWFAAPERDTFREFGLEALNAALEKGVFALNNAELKRYNPDMVEFSTPSDPSSGTRIKRDWIFYNSIVTLSTVPEALEQTVKGSVMPDIFKVFAVGLLIPFVKENVFFSHEDSRMRVDEAIKEIKPVTRNIEKGQRIIKKGFVITGEQMRQLEALNLSASGKDPRSIVALALIIMLIYLLLIFMRNGIVMGRQLQNCESYLLSTLVCFYLSGVVLVKNVSPGGIEYFPSAIIFPTALLVMIPAAFLGARAALGFALALPLGAFLSGSFDISSYIFALISGVTASTVLREAEKRMDLIKAGLIIGAANCFAIIVIQLTRHAAIGEYPVLMFWAALNGIISAMLVLGVLPPLEHALNAVNPFRLLELSDLNAPTLRKLFTAAPGTYSHSIMVANLAEQACQDIGANALLARVGAYYHDIGKMENPGYFVENQTDHNRHDDISPRLSATVIRSHVKLGIEKALSLGLPKDVISIIGEHHGNSLIAYFYDKASHQEEQVNAEDFTYLGTPPRSRESAVVMLADVTEAAVRTLIKPTASKLEKFIQQLFDAKVQHGQLADSELTFRELEIIKMAFVKTLAGYYHSRIEYPDQKKEGNGNGKEAEAPEQKDATG